MELTIDFRAIITAISCFALAIVLLSLLLVVRAVYLRRAAAKRETDVARLRAQWEPVLTGTPQHRDTLPPIPPAHVLNWMLLWNQAHDAANTLDDAQVRHQYLNDIASREGMRAKALAWTRRRDVVEQLTAVTMLGNLHETAASPMLRSLCDSSNPLLSVAAAHALLHIDRTFADRFAVLMAQRSDWAPGKLVTAVREEHETLTEPLLRLCRTAPAPIVRAIVPYLRYLAPEKTLPALRSLLQPAADASTLTAGLKVLAAAGTSADADLAATFVPNESWRVRVQAANTLGALGSESHIPALTTLLDDEHWWVRYRAAQALALIAERGKTDLTPILHSRQDPFARDVLTQVLAERTPLLQGAAT